MANRRASACAGSISSQAWPTSGSSDRARLRLAQLRGGTQILSREARDRDVYFVVSGKVRVTTYSAAGRQVTFRDCGPGEFFGEVVKSRVPTVRSTAG